MGRLQQMGDTQTGGSIAGAASRAMPIVPMPVIRAVVAKRSGVHTLLLLLLLLLLLPEINDESHKFILYLCYCVGDNYCMRKNERCPPASDNRWSE